MWFNNVLIYQYELDEQPDFVTLLAEEQLKPCPPHARFIYGFIPAFGDELIHEVAGASLVCLGKEERILPRGVINRFLAEKIEAIELQQGRTVKRAEKAQLAEDLEFELLPKSFCVQKKLPAILDVNAKRLLINTASETQATQLTGLLRKAIPGLSIQPLSYHENLSSCFSTWINDPSSLPKSFQLAADCLLFSPSDDKKRVACKGYELPSEEISNLLSQGLVPSELSLIWNERIQFTLTQDFILKRLKCLDYLIDEYSDIRKLEEEYLQRDAELTLLAGELRGLINDLLILLGNSVKAEELTAAI